MKDEFIPLDANNIKVYACGPTVYQRPHIGNLRTAVVTDLIVRLMQFFYPNVTYVRNITDVNDKIEHAFQLQDEISDIWEFVDNITTLYHDDLSRLSCLQPTHEPRVSTSIEMIIRMINLLLQKGNAYIAQNGDVLFDVRSNQYYGCLSNRSLDEMEFGTRELADSRYKKHPGDFALWKKCTEEKKLKCVFQSPWGIGVPGWHIECSAMSSQWLGKKFDIHCGGIDLLFPHHENELAQSACAHSIEQPVNYWIHNGLLTIEKNKMSKSIGNTKILDDIACENVGMDEFRYFLLSTHYRKPLNYNQKAVADIQKLFQKIRIYCAEYLIDIGNSNGFKNYCAQFSKNEKMEYLDEMLYVMSDDLNVAKASALIHSYLKKAKEGSKDGLTKVLLYLDLIGVNLIL